ncbi:MAG: plastocyanin/azurin family copper-binding protein [Bacteroidota bacterium]|nr:plastocyanin/azurin family copper-binding protein [Bacteroidota bacterium]
MPLFYHYRPLNYIKKGFVFLLCILFSTGGFSQEKQDTTGHTEKEEDFYKIVTLPIPENVILEVGGMTFLPDDALAVSTRHGEVWIIHNPYMKNGELPRYHLFAQGLHEALGLNYIFGDLYVTQRSELTRLRDLDGDGEADEYKTIYSWPLAGNYHEYAYGPVLDKDSNMIETLNLGWIGYGESLSKWHGWMLKITRDGKMKPFATGLRSPAGFALNDKGDIFYAENQGDWVGSGSITHVEEGDFLGNPAGLIWSGEPGSPVKLKKSDIPDTGEPKYEVAKRVPGLKTPSVWFPHTILGISTSGILSYESKGKMGPFEGQLFVGDQGQSKIMRVYLEKIKGVYQGVVFPFREGFSSGILRLNWGSDGSMFVGMTARGWDATGGGLYGLQRLVWNGKMPFEMKTVQARPDGFEIEFTQPVDEKTARDVFSWKISSFTYMYHHEYGSPIINQGTCPIKAIAVSPDHLKVRLVVDSMKLGYIHEIRAEGVRSSDQFTLLHNFGYYTLNRIPDGEKLAITSENKVDPKLMEHHMMMMEASAHRPSPAASKKFSGNKHLTRQPIEWKTGPDRTIVIGTKPGLKFDLEAITVKAGSRVKLTFRNNDDMLHNFVITRPGTANKVGEASVKMGLNGEKMNFVPVMPEVMFYTNLLHPKESNTIYFTAPEKAGEYVYICTYPGHYMVMRGVLKVIPR